ncbi:aBC transporter permease/ATP-binding protein [Clostridium sp. CAG:1013]|nr:aBC transporter permease/ATP-binding protein [Clostridium sp. CAG:1013]
MRIILKRLGRHPAALVLIVVSVVLSAAASLLMPACLAEMINVHIPAGDMGSILESGGIMLVLALVGALCLLVNGYLAARVSASLGKELRDQVFRKVIYFSKGEVDRFSLSSLITRTTNDIMQVQNFVTMLLRVCLMAPVICVVGSVMAYCKSPSLSVFVLISLPMMLTIIWIIARKSTPLSQIMQKQLDRLNLVTREKLSGVRVTRAFGMEAHEEERFGQANQEYRCTASSLGRWMGSMEPSLRLVMTSTTVAILAFGAWQMTAAPDSVLVGDLIAVIQYVLQINMSVILLSIALINYPRVIVSAQRINEVLETTCSIPEPASSAPAKEKGTVCFENVSFTFPGADKPVLQNINFTSKPGEVTAIIGSTGSGKSSIANLILRFYDVTEGRILVDGQDIRSYSLHDLRRKIGFVPQKNFLFSGTIQSNIRFGCETAGAEEVQRAAKTAQSLEFIEKKEDGFDSPVSRGGTNVSGGQRQRLAIARALVRDPEILIFDDSFSALDFKTDAALRKALKEQSAGKTTILVAQRVSTIQHAERILVLDEGVCVGQGTHQQLLESCEVYREIVRSQFRKEEEQ